MQVFRDRIDLCKFFWSSCGFWDIITPTQRRRTRRQRSEARFFLWLHRSGQQRIPLTKLLAYRSRLASHHSRDPVHLQYVKKTLWKHATPMADSKQPWRCAACKRLIKAATVYCPTCGGHWAQVQDQSYLGGQNANPQQNNAGWSWERWSDKGSTTRRRSPRQRSQSQTRRRKGKGGKGSDQLEGASLTSFPSLPPSPFAVAGGVSSYAVPAQTLPWPEKPSEQSANYELLQAVKKAYPDPTVMPPELKEIVDKNESTETKRITSELHKATAALGRATRQLQELQETKSQHRSKWLQHLTASLEAWQSQTETYDKQQEQFNQLISQANQELHTARKSIQQLNAKAAKDQSLIVIQEDVPALLPAPAEASADSEEQKLREKMQEVMKMTALAVAPLDPSKVPDPAAPHPKRPRSEERTPGEVSVMMDLTGTP